MPKLATLRVPDGGPGELFRLPRNLMSLRSLVLILKETP